MTRRTTMQRREFLGALTVSACAPLAAGECVLRPVGAGANEAQLDTSAQRPAETVRGEMLYRMLGCTGEGVSLVGLGGQHVGRQKDEYDRIRIIRRAFD